MSAPRGELERMIYAAAYAARLEERIAMRYPEAWREADRATGTPPGDGGRLAEWEQWCADLAISWAWTAVEMHRAAQKRRDAE